LYQEETAVSHLTAQLVGFRQFLFKIVAF